RHLVFLHRRARRRLVFLRGDEGEAPPHLSARGRGHYLVFPREDEAVPRSPARRRGVSSSSSSGTKCRLVFPCGDEIAPRSPAGRRGAASSSSSGMRRRLAFPRRDEAAPRSPTPRLPAGMRRRLVSPVRRGYASGMHCAYRSMSGTILYRSDTNMPIGPIRRTLLKMPLIAT
ncbi:hypothetical protein GW17_00050579, partial [Ensete ventricosum]